MASYSGETSQVIQDSTGDARAAETNAAISQVLMATSADDGTTVVSNPDTLEQLAAISSATDLLNVDLDKLFPNSADAPSELTIPAAPFTQIIGAQFEPGDIPQIQIDFSAYTGEAPPVITADNLANHITIMPQDTDEPVGVLIDAGGGDDTVEAGSGNDTVIGGGGNDSISAGAGADSIQAGIGQDSIDGGTGVDLVSLDAPLSNVEVSVEDDGTVVVRDVTTGEQVVTDNADYIELSDGSAIINAADQGDATAGRLVSSTVGEYDYEDYRSAFDLDDEAGNIDLVAFAGNLLAQTDLGDLSDQEFIETLYRGTFGRSVDPEGLDFYLNALDTGDKSRAEVFADLGWSEEGVEHFGLVNEIDGTV